MSGLAPLPFAPAVMRDPTGEASHLLHKQPPFPRSPIEDKRGRMMLLTLGALCVGVMAKVAGDLSLPSALNAVMLNESGTKLGVDKQSVRMLLGAGTLAYAIGKLFVSPLVDIIGGAACFRSMLLVCLFAHLVIGFASGETASSLVFGGWLLFSFMSAQAWGALLAVVAGWVDSYAHGAALATLSAAAELTSVSLLAAYAVMLADAQLRHPIVAAALVTGDADAVAEWRRPFFIAAAVTLVALVVQGTSVHSSAAAARLRPPRGPAASPTHPLAHASMSGAMCVFVRQPRAWLAAAAVVVYSCKELTLLGFVAAYARANIGPHAAEASYVLTINALGKLVVLIGAARWYDSLSPRAVFVVVSLTAVTAVIAAAAWTVMHETHTMSPTALHVLLVVGSAGQTLAWHLPPQLFMLRFGGIRHVALFSSVVDAVAALGAAALQSTTEAHLDETNDWTWWLWTQLSLALVAATLSVLLVWREWREESPAGRALTRGPVDKLEQHMYAEPATHGADGHPLQR